MDRSTAYNVADAGGLGSVVRTALLVIVFLIAAALYRQSWSRTNMMAHAGMSASHLRYLLQRKSKREPSRE